jgi:hypothetical protein
VTLPYALSDSPPSLHTTGTATSTYVTVVRCVLCARVARWKDQMMAVSVDWKLTRCSSVFLEKLTVPQLIKQFPGSYDFDKFIIAFNGACYLTLTCAQSIQFILPSHFLNIRFTIILPSTPRSSKWTLSLRSQHRNAVCTCPVMYTSTLLTLSHSC